MTRSFRDPSGTCWVGKEHVIRVLDEAGATACDSFLSSGCAQSFLKSGRLIGTRAVVNGEAEHLSTVVPPPVLSAIQQRRCRVFGHDRVPFVSYPHEWSPRMLHAAGDLTLSLARESLNDGFCLKDATPLNVLFRGPNPVFVDVPSFEKRDPADPTWNAYAQFVRTFLLPLLVHRKWGVSLRDIFTTRRDGLEPQDVYRYCSFLDRFAAGVFSLVSVPTWLSSRAKARGAALYRPRRMDNSEKARFILESLLKHCQRKLEKLHPRPAGKSTWSDYMLEHSYSSEAFKVKERFVREWLDKWTPARVLDAGANTGHFSALAANAGAAVVAIDLDPACVDGIYGRALDQNLNVLPLVVDLARPSPALGWQNAECDSFLTRAKGSFDCVLMLALIHHLMVTERIPLEEIIKLAAQFTTSHAIIELVLPQDDMFKALTRGRESLHADLDEQRFENACREYFDIEGCVAVPGVHRRLYALKRKSGGDKA